MVSFGIWTPIWTWSDVLPWLKEGASVSVNRGLAGFWRYTTFFWKVDKKESSCVILSDRVLPIFPWWNSTHTNRRLEHSFSERSEDLALNSWTCYGQPLTYPQHVACSQRCRKSKSREGSGYTQSLCSPARQLRVSDLLELCICPLAASQLLFLLSPRSGETLPALAGGLA